MGGMLGEIYKVSWYGAKASLFTFHFWGIRLIIKLESPCTYNFLIHASITAYNPMMQAFIFCHDVSGLEV